VPFSSSNSSLTATVSPSPYPPRKAEKSYLISPPIQLLISTVCDTVISSPLEAYKK